jgi:hypothetical protein
MAGAIGISLELIRRAKQLRSLLGDAEFARQLDEVSGLLDVHCEIAKGVSRHDVMMEMVGMVGTDYPVEVNLLALASIQNVDWLDVSKATEDTL